MWCKLTNMKRQWFFHETCIDGLFQGIPLDCTSWINVNQLRKIITVSPTKLTVSIYNTKIITWLLMPTEDPWEHQTKAWIPGYVLFCYNRNKQTTQNKKMLVPFKFTSCYICHQKLIFHLGFLALKALAILSHNHPCKFVNHLVCLPQIISNSEILGLYI